MIPYDKTTWLSADALAWCDGIVDRLLERIAAKAEAQRTPDYAAQGETAYCTAIAVRNMAESERIANYDAQNGKGAWAKKVARDAAWEADAPARRARRARIRKTQRWVRDRRVRVIQTTKRIPTRCALYRLAALRRSGATARSLNTRTRS